MRDEVVGVRANIARVVESVATHLSPLARQLIAATIAVSTLIAFLATGIQLYFDYRADIKAIDNTFALVEQAYIPTITAAVWSTNNHQLQVALNGLINLPNMHFVEVTEGDNVIAQAGAMTTTNIDAREFKLVQVHRGESLDIGKLHIVADLTGIYRSLLNKFWVILISNGVKTALVAVFMLWLFDWLVTRHLRRVANFAAHLDASNLHERLSLARSSTATREGDEFDQVTEAFTRMQANLDTTLRDLEKIQRDLAHAQAIAKTGSFTWDLRTNRFVPNENLRRLLKPLAHKVDVSFDDIVQMADVDDRVSLAAVKQRLRGESRTHEVNFRVKLDLAVDHTFMLFVSADRYDDAGNPCHAVGTIQDVTERDRIKQILGLLASGNAASAEEFYRLAVRELADAYRVKVALIGLISDDDKNKVRTVAVWSDKFVENFEYNLKTSPCGDMLNAKVEFVPDHVAKRYPHDQMLIDMNARSYYGAPLVDHTGKNIGVIAVIDTAPMQLDALSRPLLSVFAQRVAAEVERARALDDLQRTLTHLEERVEERTRQVQVQAIELRAKVHELEAFSYSVSHDLRGPLRAIDGFCHLLMEDYAHAFDATGRDYLDRVRRAAQRMGNLVDDLLRLAQLTRIEMKFEKIDFSEMANSVADEICMRYPHMRVDLAIQPSLTLNGDQSLIRALLENLLDNAWKYSSKTAKPKVEVGAFRHDGRNVFFVKDNGAGFDMEYVNKLFHPFQRLHRDDEFPGTGIGLATIKRIVQRHGGETWAEGRPAEGATIFFTIGTD